MELALFDFDGTITHGDSFLPFIRESVGPLRLGIGGALLAPWIGGYTLGRLPATKMRQLVVALAYAGRRREEVNALGRQFAERRLPSLARPVMLERIQWHREREHDVLVVSAAIDVYLKPYCSMLGVRVLCSQLESARGRLTGRYAGGDCTGAEKSRRVKAAANPDRYDRVYAYGDTLEDTELLALATDAYYRGRKVSPHADLSRLEHWSRKAVAWQ